MYTKELLIQLLKDWSERNGGEIPKKRTIGNDPSMPSEMPFRSQFGSWSKALKSAGFTPVKVIPVGAKKGKRNKLRKKVKSHDYYKVFEPTHPMATKNGYVLEHRKIAYDDGKLIDKTHEVHHINGIKTDNRSDNLMVLPKPEHTSLTHIGKSKINETHPKCRMCDARTRSKYGLCRKHYKLEWAKGAFKNIHETPELIQQP